MIQKYWIGWGFFPCKRSICFSKTNILTVSHPTSIENYTWNQVLLLWDILNLHIYRYRSEIEANVFVQLCFCFRCNSLIIEKASKEVFSLILTILAQQGNCSSPTQSLNVSWHVKMKFRYMNFLFTLALVQNNKIKQNTTCVIFRVEGRPYCNSCPVWMMVIRKTRHEEKWTHCMCECNHWDYHCRLAINWNKSYNPVTQQHRSSQNSLAECFLGIMCSLRCFAQ